MHLIGYPLEKDIQTIRTYSDSRSARLSSLRQIESQIVRDYLDNHITQHELNNLFIAVLRIRAARIAGCSKLLTSELFHLMPPS